MPAMGSLTRARLTPALSSPPSNVHQLPDLPALRLFCQERLAWSLAQCDAKLVPVCEALSDGALTQRRMQYFFDFDQTATTIRSARIKEAVGGLTQRPVSVELAPTLSGAAAPKSTAAPLAASSAAGAAAKPRRAQKKRKPATRAEEDSDFE